MPCLRVIIHILIIVLLAVNACAAQKTDIKKEYLTTLGDLCNALLERQLTRESDPDRGAIRCTHCNVMHTRASEAVYPFSVMYKATKDARYLQAAISTSDWLMKQQQPDGSWKETPEEWKGTTTDQLLMLLLSYDIIGNDLGRYRRDKWTTSMKKAAGYLAAVMKPEFASINYVATTSATLAKAGWMFNDTSLLRKAAQLARRTIAKMDDDGFINGEGGRSHGNKLGVDLGYDMEMSLWGLGLYARYTGDTLVNGYVKRSVKNHLYFIYPDGSLDASWGIRSNKWTGFGSATSDGCQVLFSLYADEDPRYPSAALRNLFFLRKNMAGDLIGYGLQHQEVFDTPPCIYPTFTKAKNIAMAYELDDKQFRLLTDLPSDKTGWLKLFPTLDLVEVRTENFMATITGYRYKDPAGAKGKYMFRPSGGAITHVWMKGCGFLQASSPTIYTRPEPMSFPEAPGVRCLTPRIEYTDNTGYFTNLFEFDSRLSIDSAIKSEYTVIAGGELKDKNQLAGGVAYKMEYLFADSFYQKTIHLVWHDAWPTITIVEPFIHLKGTLFTKINDSTLLINTGEKKLLFAVLTPGIRLITGRDEANYWSPYPALKAFPVEMEISGDTSVFKRSLTYRVSVLK